MEKLVDLMAENYFLDQLYFLGEVNYSMNGKSKEKLHSTFSDWL